MTSSLELCHFHFTSLFDDDEISLHQRVAHLTNSQPFFLTHISTDAESDPNRAPPCDPAVCVLPDCFCSEDGTQIPGDLPSKDVPQMITITFDDAINNNNIELYREMFNGKRRNPNGCDIKATVSLRLQGSMLVLLVLAIKLDKISSSHSPFNSIESLSFTSLQYFVSHKYTNYSAVQETHRRGHEIAVHSIT